MDNLMNINPDANSLKLNTKDLRPRVDNSTEEFNLRSMKKKNSIEKINNYKREPAT